MVLTRKLVLPLILVAGLAACKEETVADGWKGRWTGPEGTYLDIAGSAPRYMLTIANLDGPQTYEGTAEADGIVFTREGATEHIRAGNGVATGMKWLANKKDCLVIKAGEGFCRD